MSPSSACPRCQTVVHYEPGERPTCSACGYPGPDRRRAAAAVPPAWEHTGTRPHPHAPAEAWSERETSGKAVAALVLGISSYVLLGFIGAILGIVFGVMARKEIDASDGVLEGRAMASWGMWLGIVNLILSVLFLVLLFGIGLTMFDETPGNSGAFIFW